MPKKDQKKPKQNWISVKGEIFTLLKHQDFPGEEQGFIFYVVLETERCQIAEGRQVTAGFFLAKQNADEKKNKDH